MSPMTNKTIDGSPSKSEHKLNPITAGKSNVNKENVKLNGDSSNSNKRESLFDLRKRNKKVPEDDKTKESAASHEYSPDKIMAPEDEPKREVIKEIVEDKDEEDIESEHFEYTMFPLGIQEKDAVSYLEKYLLKLDDKQAKSYAKPKDL